MKRMLLGALVVLATATAFTMPASATAQEAEVRIERAVTPCVTPVVPCVQYYVWYAGSLVAGLCTTPVVPCVQYYIGVGGEAARRAIGDACWILFGRQCDVLP